MDLDSGIREIRNAILAFPTAAMLLVAFWLYVERNRREWRLGDRDRPGRVLSNGELATRKAVKGALHLFLSGHLRRDTVPPDGNSKGVMVDRSASPRRMQRATPTG